MYHAMHGYAPLFPTPGKGFSSACKLSVVQSQSPLLVINMHATPRIAGGCGTFAPSLGVGIPVVNSIQAR
jgi:hypothetical protein